MSASTSVRLDATCFLFSPEWFISGRQDRLISRLPRFQSKCLLGIASNKNNPEGLSSVEVHCHKGLRVPQVASPDETQQESPEATTTSSSPPQTSPPSLPEMDFFHSDPFTDREAPQASPSLNYTISWCALCNCITVFLFFF